MQSKQYTLKELASLTGATLLGDPTHLISGVDGLETATSKDASFLSNPLYREAMTLSHAGVICIDQKTEQPKGKNLLISDDPSGTFQKLIELLIPQALFQTGFQGIHPTAVIHPTAKIGADVTIGPYTVVDQQAIIGDRCCIYASVYIGSHATLGHDCTLYPQVVVRELCAIGNRVILQPGAVIGSCGFGYITDAKGRHNKLQQLGRVVIEDDVEVGACTTIDRARFKETRIGKGTKLDNLVQIGHNVELGESNIIVSQSGIAGSSKTGRHVILGGQAGVVGHVKIADGTMIATRGGVSKSIEKGGKYAGGPVMPLAEYNRWQVQLRKIGEYAEKIEELEKKIAILSKQQSN